MPTAFAQSSVPILGQAIAVEGYTIAVTARCQCQTGGSPVLLAVTCSSAGTAVITGQCAACGHGYSVQGMEIDPQARLSFQIAILSTTPSIAS